jgi:hypothetical protein
VKRKETDIQRDICEYLQIKGYFFTRMNNTPTFDPKRGCYRAMPKYTMSGFPDILILKDGNVIGCEVKTSIGKQSPTQKEFQRLWESAGGAYIVARSVQDVIDWGL